MIYSNPDHDIAGSKNPKSISGHKFQVNMIKGLLSNKVDLVVFNIQRIRVFPYFSRILIKKNGLRINGKTVGFDIPYINLPFINYFSQYLGLKKLLKYYMRDNKDENIVLMVFNTHFIQSKVVLSLKKRFPSIVTCNVIGDLYGKYGLQVTSKGIQSVWQKYVEKQQEKMQSNFDKYVLLTPMMRDVLGVMNEDSTIVEGFYEADSESDEITTPQLPLASDKKIVFYAGSLKRSYGIEHLLNSFELIKDDNYSLYIAGIGDGEDLVKEYAISDSRIKYLGFLSPKDVSVYQNMATVLISPRKSNELFVKYSFPSKTLECLASGKPYIAHKLPCEPEEYINYIQYPKNESDEALCEEIIRVCELDPVERNRIGESAKLFIQRNKNPQNMCKRIYDLLISSF